MSVCVVKIFLRYHLISVIIIVALSRKCKSTQNIRKKTRMAYKYVEYAIIIWLLRRMSSKIPTDLIQVPLIDLGHMQYIRAMHLLCEDTMINQGFSVFVDFQQSIQCHRR